MHHWFNLNEETACITNLTKRLKQIQFVLDNSVILSVTDLNGKLQYVNEKFCQLSQFTPKELIGQPYRIVNSGYHDSAFFKELWQTISTGKIWKGNICNKSKSGTRFWLATTIIPVLNDDNQPIQYIAIRKDITAQKNAEEQVRELSKELENKIKQRTENLEALNKEFASTITHYETLLSQVQSLLNTSLPHSKTDLSYPVPKRDKKPDIDFSTREHDVLQLLVDGKTNREIAEQLCITTHTVKSHISKIMQKLNVTDRTKAAITALKSGLITFNHH